MQTTLTTTTVRHLIKTNGDHATLEILLEMVGKMEYARKDLNTALKNAVNSAGDAMRHNVPGSCPNKCGVVQDVALLNTLVGKIAALEDLLGSVVYAAKVDGLLEKEVEYVA